MGEANKERVLDGQRNANSQMPRCRVCNRRLKSAAAIAQGIGKACLRKERIFLGRSPTKRKAKGTGIMEFDNPDQLLLFSHEETASSIQEMSLPWERRGNE